MRPQASTRAARPAWDGKTVVCLASGPSLTAEDVQRARGFPVVVTNTTFRLAPWADILFGFDSRWWRAHIEEVRKTFEGRLISINGVADSKGIEQIFGAPWWTQYGNSGACAISIAMCAGASKVILLGFDCGFSPKGPKHWHGDHPKGLTNCLSVQKWPYQFGKVAEHAKRLKCQVINASRHTTLKCFERADVDSVL